MAVRQQDLLDPDADLFDRFQDVGNIAARVDDAADLAPGSASGRSVSLTPSRYNRLCIDFPRNNAPD